MFWRSLFINDEDEPENAPNDFCNNNDDIVQVLKNKTDGTSIRDLIENKKFFESIFANIHRSPAELTLLLLKYSLANKLSLTGIVDLFKLVNIIFSKTVLPETRYRIDQLCNYNTAVTLHCVCPTCSKYLGSFEDINEKINCVNCDEEIDAFNPSSPSFFAIIDPSKAIADYLEMHENYYDYIIRERKHDKNIVKDIYDGIAYRNFIKTLNDHDRLAYASASFNTDGAPVFESSTFSIWPIYLLLHEIPPEERFKSTITVGLWFGQNKPEMTVYLDIFVEFMNHLATVGIPCTIKKEQRNIKLFILIGCADSVARAPMNGTVQFNGHYGCDWCLHPGTHQHGSMRYPFTVPLAEERNREQFIDYVEEAVHSEKAVYGIKNASPLLYLKGFDIVQGLTPDYMHCMLAGVVQQFTEIVILRFLSQSDLNHINGIINKIKAPRQIGRLSRPIKDRSYWKAREWENWALYYSIPIFSIFLKNKYLKHWCYLVDALYICLKEEITYAEINHANEMLFKFVSEAEALYSIQAMTYNVHQLIHIVKSVRDWGPLWAHSTFPFESANHRLLTAVHCAKGVILQIIRYCNIQRSVQILERQVYPDSSPNVIHYCENLNAPKTKKILKLTNIVYFGKAKSINRETAEKYGISRRAKTFTKIVLNGCLYSTSQKINKRSCNYYAQIQNGEFIKINQFVVNLQNNDELTICEFIKDDSHNYSTVAKEILEYSHEVSIRTSEIRSPCVVVQTSQKSYITPVPNNYHY